MDPLKYASISSGFRVLLKEQGVRGFFKGWSPTLVGYGAQGACRFGFYEFFKKHYSDIAGPEYASKYQGLIYMAASSSAEVIATTALCPMKAVKFVSKRNQVIQGTGATLETPNTVPKKEFSKTFQVEESFTCGFVAGLLSAVAFPPRADLVCFIRTLSAAAAVKKVGFWEMRRYATVSTNGHYWDSHWSSMGNLRRLQVVCWAAGLRWWRTYLTGMAVLWLLINPRHDHPIGIRQCGMREANNEPRGRFHPIVTVELFNIRN
ncbi:hypothetical protein CTI12_AA000310 [Artemisia annua]|uniref:Carrier protein n=1 Tax=Artemisia annua TaxID=35608 RepID=A0A2U1QJU2_ARTAN|nr:hypothetical protein CTI12_AA000310 [Artemisia annua]